VAAEGFPEPPLAGETAPGQNLRRRSFTSTTVRPRQQAWRINPDGLGKTLLPRAWEQFAPAPLPVYVHSNQPHTDAMASADGYSFGYETDGSGYALIYLNGPPPGALITVTVGGATCTTSDLPASRARRTQDAGGRWRTGFGLPQRRHRHSTCPG
jgi:hypothetical protein